MLLNYLHTIKYKYLFRPQSTSADQLNKPASGRRDLVTFRANEKELARRRFTAQLDHRHIQSGEHHAKSDHQQ